MCYKNKKSIAILMAVYNGEQYLVEQLNSLVSQTCNDWNLYIRDDDSTDSTKDILNLYASLHENIQIVSDALGNLGCTGNFLQLLEVVESDYYMFCDADDVWLPEKVQLSFDFLKKLEADHVDTPLLVHTDKLVCNHELQVISNSSWRSKRFNPDLFVDFHDIPLYVVGGACSIFNAKVRVHALSTPPFLMAHDAWVALVTSKYGKIFALHTPLIMYRQHNSNTIGHNAKRKGTTFERITEVPAIVQQHLLIAKHLKDFGYGSFAKYFYYRIVIRLKLLYCFFTVR